MFRQAFQRWALWVTVQLAFGCTGLTAAAIPVVTLAIRSARRAGEPTHQRVIVACALDWTTPSAQEAYGQPNQLADSDTSPSRASSMTGAGADPAREPLESSAPCQLPALCRWEQSARDSALADSNLLLEGWSP